ncbi:MAG: hypothetical protein BWX50_01417 [Euryarchaeota archaeon ADurb.Bin009]|nr:MAG: hypothetical protein BWX50_01417 [Euryarchaeota archaeon ADurb.Bin009]
MRQFSLLWLAWRAIIESAMALDIESGSGFKWVTMQSVPSQAASRS